jgi:hypothetical protein
MWRCIVKHLPTFRRIAVPSTTESSKLTHQQFRPKNVKSRTNNIYDCHPPHNITGGSGSIATRYGLEGPGFESRWGRDFPHPYRPALGPNRVSFPVVMRPGRATDHTLPSRAEVKVRAELYLYSPVSPHGLLLRVSPRNVLVGWGGMAPWSGRQSGALTPVQWLRGVFSGDEVAGAWR